jgi:hypothetical protein
MARIAVKIIFPNSKLIDFTEAIEFRQGLVVKNPAPVLTPELPWEVMAAGSKRSN